MSVLKYWTGLKWEAVGPAAKDVQGSYFSVDENGILTIEQYIPKTMVTINTEDDQDN